MRRAHNEQRGTRREAGDAQGGVRGLLGHNNRVVIVSRRVSCRGGVGGNDRLIRHRGFQGLHVGNMHRKLAGERLGGGLIRGRLRGVGCRLGDAEGFIEFRDTVGTACTAQRGGAGDDVESRPVAVDDDARLRLDRDIARAGVQQADGDGSVGLDQNISTGRFEVSHHGNRDFAKARLYPGLDGDGSGARRLDRVGGIEKHDGPCRRPQDKRTVGGDGGRVVGDVFDRDRLGIKRERPGAGGLQGRFCQ